MMTPPGTPYSHALRAARRLGWSPNDAKDYAYLRRQGYSSYDAWSIVKDA